ncbi:TetR/AcrR family transcriptional regulator [uncultured Corynebacterium sp.]|uniref:TetR/AcrR family transcriptional regulator n=1 Tax=uncultured Corynebacterium sp. TaxID=159447 RepID=UPI0025F8FD45|nr:TetR/AcrR family transcriptional regulator [uncultured Corynebacterium sp.]
MTSRSDRAREALLDAAEALFALHGIDAVSDRAIAEEAGTANHSAVGYHFGGRDGLLCALLARETEGKAATRAAMVDALPGPPTVRDALVAHVLPWVHDFAGRPAPVRRARFLARVTASPRATGHVDDSAPNMRLGPFLDDCGISVAGVPHKVLTDRARMLDAMMLQAFSSFEEGLEQKRTSGGDWVSVGWFLIDAGAGLLTAPVTGGRDYRTV